MGAGGSCYYVKGSAERRLGEKKISAGSGGHSTTSDASLNETLQLEVPDITPFEGHPSPGPSLAPEVQRTVLLRSHSPLALALKVIDLLHLHPFDTCDQGSKEVGKGSPWPCRTQEWVPTARVRWLGEALTEIFYQEGEEAWWGDKRSGW